MHNALTSIKAYKLPYYYSIYNDYYCIITVYCLLDTAGATCGAPSRRHLREPSLAPENLFLCEFNLCGWDIYIYPTYIPHTYIYIYIHIYTYIYIYICVCVLHNQL